MYMYMYMYMRTCTESDTTHNDLAIYNQTEAKASQ